MQDSYLQFHGHLAGSAVFHVGMIKKGGDVCFIALFSMQRCVWIISVSFLDSVLFISSQLCSLINILEKSEGLFVLEN